MKLLNKLSLRMRITLLTGLIVLTASLCLTLTSMYNARSRFSPTVVFESISTVPNIQSEEAEGVWKEETSESIDMRSHTVLPPVDVEMAQVPASLITASKKFDGWGYIYLFIISAAGMVAVYFVSGRALKPVTDLSNAALHISGNNLEERIPEGIAMDEIASLTGSFNSMLDRLEQSFQQQKQFSANAAHELKTPLATMNAGIQVLHLDESPTVEDCLETLHIVEHNVKRLTDVVDNLFLLTKESAEEYTDTIPIKELFADILEELTPLYTEKHLETVCNIGITSIKGNRTLIRRAFFNLVENAMKYSYDKGKITICAENGEIAVSNTGTVIPEEDLDKIFEPFYRVDRSRSRHIGGAGLGLSIVKVIAEKHGFTVKAECISDVETRITMTIS